MASEEKFGKIHLPVRDGLTPEDMQHVPTVSAAEKFIDNSGVLETVALGLLYNKPVLLVGETGTGKTSAVRYICAKTNTPFRRINLNGSTTVDDMVGRTLLDKDGTYWIDGVLLDAMKKGHVLLVDEINAGLPEVLFILHALLDDDQKVTLMEKDGAVVRPHPDFRLVATMNPPHAYVGTKMLNKALLSRFAIIAEVDFSSMAQEKKILQTRFPDRKVVDDAIIDRMTKFAEMQRKAYAKGATELVISTRDLIHWVFLAEKLNDIPRACLLAVINKAPMEERDALIASTKLLFGLDIATLETIAKTGGAYEKGNKVYVPAQATSLADFSPTSVYVGNSGRDKKVELPQMVVLISKDPSGVNVQAKILTMSGTLEIEDYEHKDGEVYAFNFAAIKSIMV
jgi:MoxR-like ATPase